jgi:hypothetical protein
LFLASPVIHFACLIHCFACSLDEVSFCIDHLSIGVYFYLTLSIVFQISICPSRYQIGGEK